RRQAAHQHASSGVTEAGQRLSPIFLLAVGRPFFARYLLAPGNQARALTTLDDALIQLGKRLAAHLRFSVVQFYRTSMPPPRRPRIMLALSRDDTLAGVVASHAVYFLLLRSLLVELALASTVA